MSPPRLSAGWNFLEHEKDFAIIAAGLMFRLNVDRAYLSAILAAGQIGTGRKVRVIESQSPRPGREGDAAHAMRRNKGGSFFRCAVHIDRYVLAVPVQLFGNVGVVMDIDNDLLAFPEAQQRPGKLSVIRRGRNDAVRCQFHEPVADPDRVIRGSLR